MQGSIEEAQAEMLKRRGETRKATSVGRQRLFDQRRTSADSTCARTMSDTNPICEVHEQLTSGFKPVYELRLLTNNHKRSQGACAMLVDLLLSYQGH